MAENKNSLNAWVLLAAPIFVFLALYQLIPAISIHLITNWVGMVVYLTVASLIGIFLFRNARTVRDHEWHRRKHIRKLQKDYAAEDRGVWSKADLAMSELEADARGVESGQMSKKALQKLDGNISGLTSERVTSELQSNESDLDNVSLFTESEHVKRSTSRVTGESGPVESVQGVTHAKVEPVKKSIIGGVLDILKESSPNPTSNPTTATSQSVPENADWYTQEMQGSSTMPSSMVETETAQSMMCSSCGYGNPRGESYCENCGNRL
ncbi:MAG: zinc ribbon domain-containing protein [Candidatus Thermoplasmatota archaeon]|nr:zinc ribbon domain-containing protein [Candidatus Thermoplasmatota archaeon]